MMDDLWALFPTSKATWLLVVTGVTTLAFAPADDRNARAMLTADSVRVSWPLFANTKPAAWRSMCGCTLKPILAALQARSISLARPATVNRAQKRNEGRLCLAL